MKNLLRDIVAVIYSLQENVQSWMHVGKVCAKMFDIWLLRELLELGSSKSRISSGLEGGRGKVQQGRQ